MDVPKIMGTILGLGLSVNEDCSILGSILWNYQRDGSGHFEWSIQGLHWRSSVSGRRSSRPMHQEAVV